jgi:hypothetical protein
LTPKATSRPFSVRLIFIFYVLITDVLITDVLITDVLITDVLITDVLITDVLITYTRPPLPSWDSIGDNPLNQRFEVLS